MSIDSAAMLSCLARSTVLLAGGLLVVQCMRRAPAAALHAMLCATAVAVLLVPVVVASRIEVPLSSRWIRDGRTIGSALLAATPWASPAVDVELPSQSPPRVTHSSHANWTRALAPVMLIAWLLGVAAHLGRMLVSLWGVRQIVRASSNEAPPTLTENVSGIVRRCCVEIVFSGAVDSPVAAGLLHSRILLPARASAWPPAVLNAVLAHESAHVHRRDTLTQLISRLMCAVHWYNPLAWHLLKRQQLEAEVACDDAALDAGVEPRDYATALVSIARASRPSMWTPAVVPMALRASELEARVSSVLTPRTTRRLSPAGGMAVTTSAVAMMLTVGAIRLSGATVDMAAPLHAAAAMNRIANDEPDQRGDSVTSPLSERIPTDGDIVTRARRAAVGLMAGQDSTIARRLISVVDHRPTFAGDLVGERARWSLAQAREGELVQFLIEKMAAADWRERAYAAWALSAATDERPVLPLVNALADPIWRVRANAAASLAAFGTPRAHDAMVRALSDDAWQVRAEAVRYLAHVSNDADRHLLLMAASDRHVAVRTAAESALRARH